MVRARSATRDPAARRRAGLGPPPSPEARPSPPFLPGAGAGSRAGRPPPLRADKGGGERPCVLLGPGRETPGASGRVAREGGPGPSETE